MKWYVFDQFDCFFGHDTAEEAARQAQNMVSDGMEGIHIAYLTRAQFDAYCKHSNLKQALLVK